MTLRITGLRKAFGALVVTDGVNLTVAGPGLHALIGPNGAGKTTLIDQVMGTLAPDAGRITLDGADLTGLAPHRRARAGLARTFQTSQLVPDFTARQHVALALQGRRLSPWTPPRPGPEADDALATVGLGVRAGVQAQDLSHGERRALELATALATRPTCLLLDEPLAGMGHDEAARIIALLGTLATRLALLLVEHDMDAVFRLADRITVLVAGRVVAEGPPAAVRADPAVRAAYLGEPC